MSLSTVYWLHDPDADGGDFPNQCVYEMQTGNDVGTHVVAFGGFGTVGPSSLDEATNIGGLFEEPGAVLMPVSGWRYNDNPVNDTRYGVIYFALPRTLSGTRFQAHIWWTLEA